MEVETDLCEIEKRPAARDIKSSEYSNRTLKRDAWDRPNIFVFLFVFVLSFFGMWALWPTNTQLQIRPFSLNVYNTDYVWCYMVEIICINKNLLRIFYDHKKLNGRFPRLSISEPPASEYFEKLPVARSCSDQRLCKTRQKWNMLNKMLSYQTNVYANLGE